VNTKHKVLQISLKATQFPNTTEHPRLQSFRNSETESPVIGNWFEQVTSAQGHNLQLCWALWILSVTSLCLVMGDLTLADPHLLSQKEERKRGKSKQNPKRNRTN
jgi:hypothetical protein